MNPVVMLIAKILAPTYLIIAIMTLSRPCVYDTVIEDFKKSPALIYFSGLIVLAIGILWVNSIFSFVNFTEGFFSVLGLMAVLKGAILLICPEALFSMSYTGKGFKIFAALFTGAIGMWCLSLGYGLF